MKYVLIALVLFSCSQNQERPKFSAEDLKNNFIVLDDDTIYVQSFGHIGVFPTSLDSNMLVTMSGDTTFILRGLDRVRKFETRWDTNPFGIQILSNVSKIEHVVIRTDIWRRTGKGFIIKDSIKNIHIQTLNGDINLNQ